MAALGASRLAARNYALIRLKSLSIWGTYTNPYMFSSKTFNKWQHLVNKCQPWNKSNSQRCYFVTRSSKCHGQIVSKSQECFLNVKNTEIVNVARSSSIRTCIFSEKWLKKDALFGTLSWKLQNITDDQIIRSFHGSPSLKAAPLPILWMILKPVQKLLAIILGR